ncbi:TetR/AcrR family transcriptional regulator [bacterium]|nr:TetR/AcrR family transcriptional regulator [bacterium]
MAKKSGRPLKAEGESCRRQILEAAVRLIKKCDAGALTVRNVCREANVGIGTFYFYFQNKDDLLMHFLRETSFDRCALKTPLENIADRIAELYMYQIERYQELGFDFMKSFYSTGNKPLSAYLGASQGAFPADTVMARCESELAEAQKSGVISENTNIRELSMDICTIVKGCVFEWCLTEGAMDIEASLYRLVRRYMHAYLNQAAEDPSK